MARRVEAECGAPELSAGERLHCRQLLLRRMTDELAAADPAIAAARAAGASDAELTPLYEARFSELRRRVIVGLADDTEAEEMAAAARALREPPARCAADEVVDDTMVPAEVREAVAPPASDEGGVR